MSYLLEICRTSIIFVYGLLKCINNCFIFYRLFGQLCIYYRTHIYIYSLDIHTPTLIYTYIFLCNYIYIHAHTHTHVYIYIYIHIYKLTVYAYIIGVCCLECNNDYYLIISFRLSNIDAR